MLMSTSVEPDKTRFGKVGTKNILPIHVSPAVPVSLSTETQSKTRRQLAQGGAKNSDREDVCRCKATYSN